MARVPYLTPADLPPDSPIPLMKANITRAVANSPGAARLVAGMGAYLRNDSPLDPKLRELAILQVGYTTRSVYEWAHHVEIGMRFGLTGEDIRAIGRDSEGQASHLEPLAKAVLAAAREMTIHMKLSDEIFAVLREGLALPALVDLLVAALTALVALLLPRSLGYHHAPLLCLLALCALGLGLAVWRFTLYLRRVRHDRKWLGHLEAAVAAGGTIFD